MFKTDLCRLSRLTVVFLCVSCEGRWCVAGQLLT